MAFRTKKISQMDPKGSNLASTDLLEISQLVSGSYVTKSITGAQIAASAPAAAWGTITGTLSSQTDLNTALSGKQATVTLTTTGTGAATFVSNVLNVPTPAAATFSSLTTTGSSGASTLTSGVLNVPTYSLSGLGGVPTTRTLTINGTTQDLSADRTFTVSTGITIGTTAITSGTVGRVLFEGTGNVVQESAQLSWNNSTNALTVTTGKVFSGYNSGGSASDALKLELTGGGAVLGIQNSNASGFSGVEYLNNSGSPRVFTGFNNSNGQEFRFNNFATLGYIDFLIGGTTALKIFTSRNIGLNTNTDAGFKLDVNGTARVATSIVINGSASLLSSSLSIYQNSTNRVFSLATSTAKTSASERILFSLNSNDATNQQAMDFGYIGATLINDRYFYLQTSESSVGYGGGLVMQHNGGWASVGSATQIPSSVFHITSTTKGFLPPRMTTTQKNAIASPATGLMLYDTTLNVITYYNGTTWI